MGQGQTGESTALTSRAERKRAAILDAAGEVFLANGYLGASMDEVASVASVSKQTVYKHFKDKATLFEQLVTRTVQGGDDGTAVQVPERGAVEHGLRNFARTLLRGVMQPHVLALRRLIIGEVNRFPDLGAKFYELGIARTTATLAATLSALRERGELQVDDVDVAAEHLLWLVLSIPLNRAMLLGDDHGITDAELDRYADAGVRTFCRAYSVLDELEPS